MNNLGRILIRVDSGQIIGHGHLFRCLNLARYLKAQGAIVIFATRHHRGSIVNQAIEGFECIDLTSATLNTKLNDVTSWLGVPEPIEINEVKSLLKETLFDWVIADHYGLSEHWFDELKLASPQTRFLAIDDLANRKLPVELILNQNLFSLPEHYNELIGSNSLVLAGTSYALLQPSLKMNGPKNYKTSNRSQKNVLIAMGGTDPHNATLLVCKSLQNLANTNPQLTGTENVFNIKVALSSTASGIDELTEFCEQNSNVSLLLDADLNELNHWADFAIGACGISAWERALVGLPSILITTAENQIKGATALQTAGAAVYLGYITNISHTDIVSSVNKLTNDKCKEMSELSRNLLDTNGTKRIFNALRLHNSQQLDIRSATDADLILLYHWQLQTNTRCYFRNKAIPKFVDHVHWFKGLSQKTQLNIIEYEGVACGYIRLDQLDEKEQLLEVSILISDGFKGKKLSVKALNWLIEHTKDSLNNGSCTLVAEIAPENSASIRAFTIAGFEQTAKDRYSIIINRSSYNG
jgi:UDP-2,4-diacetamido-2,4,6-trideoxy-beta-L-altropyranose hydrolase